MQLASRFLVGSFLGVVHLPKSRGSLNSISSITRLSSRSFQSSGILSLEYRVSGSSTASQSQDSSSLLREVMNSLSFFDSMILKNHYIGVTTALPPNIVETWFWPWQPVV